MDYKVINVFLKPTKEKLILTIIPLLSVIIFVSIKIHYYGININAWSLWFGESFKVLPLYLILWYIASCFILIKKNMLTIISSFVILFSVVYMINLPSFIVDFSVKGMSCETRDDCWNICEERCEYDLFDKIIYPRPYPTSSNQYVLAIGNCEGMKCTGCDCCWGCKID